MSQPREPPAVSHTVGRREIDIYAELSGDYNPLHVDPEFAATTQFGSVIAHGPLAVQVLFDSVSRWLGADGFPPGLTVDVRFSGPVRIGDRVSLQVGDSFEHASRVAVMVKCVNQRGEDVIEALLTAPSALLPRSS